MSVFIPNSLPVTSLYAGLVGIGFVLSSFQVGLTRVQTKKMYGADKDTELQHRSRAQGNFIEYGGIGIILLALMEYNSILGHSSLWWWGLAFTVMRFAHAIQLNAPNVVPKLFRAGAFLTTLVLLGFASFKLLLHGLGK